MYIMKKEIVRAPVHGHPCQLTKTYLTIADPKALSTGHRGASSMKILRSVGMCMCTDKERMSTCTATRVRGRSVNGKGVQLEEELTKHNLG